MSYEERRDAYLKHIHGCTYCMLRFTVTKEPCRRGCCYKGYVSYWTIWIFCKEGEALINNILP